MRGVDSARTWRLFTDIAICIGSLQHKIYVKGNSDPGEDGLSIVKSGPYKTMASAFGTLLRDAPYRSIVRVFPQSLRKQCQLFFYRNSYNKIDIALEKSTENSESKVSLEKVQFWSLACF